jgi:hypothetical protein
MRQFRGTPFERDLRQAISKLSELLPDGVSVRLSPFAPYHRVTTMPDFVLHLNWRIQHAQNRTDSRTAPTRR